MSKIQHNLADVETLQPVPKDWYPAHVIKYSYADSKASIQRGAPEKMFSLDWEIDEGEFAGRKILFDGVSLSPKAAGFLAEFLDGIKMERTCLNCRAEFTEAKRVSKEDSKINKAGLACPHCNDQGPTEWEAGEPTGQALMARRCRIGVTLEPALKDGQPVKNTDGSAKMVNRVEHYLPIK